MTAYEGQQAVDDEERARKRAEIGLAPMRPTARTTLQRPPDETETRGCLWLPVWLLGGMVLATLLLLAAMFLGSPTTWPGVRGILTAWLPTRVTITTPTNSDTTLPPAGYRLIATDNFTQNEGLLACNQQDGQWDMAYAPSESVYHMQIWPNRLGWSTLGAGVLRNVRLEASFQVADVLPDGYAGLLARYQNRDNFYFFGVDGRGRYQVQLLQDGQLQTLIPWMEAGWLKLAGSPNVLALEDDGTTLRLFINQHPVFEVSNPLLPVGDAGVFGAASTQSTAEINLDWLRLYERNQPNE